MKNFLQSLLRKLLGGNRDGVANSMPASGREVGSIKNEPGSPGATDMSLSKPVEPAPPVEPARSVESIPGHLSQHPQSNGRSGRIQLIIGLDFGTSFTKVVIAEQRRAYAVPFDGIPGVGGNPYLLPGFLAIPADGRMQLGTVAGAHHHSGMKMRILGGDRGRDIRKLATAFVALVFQHARAWFFQAHGRTYVNHTFDWCVNVGLPTEHYHDDALMAFYRDIVDAAWAASIRPTALDLEAVDACLDGRQPSLGREAIGLFPEFVAQVSGYVRTPLRRSDLHLLMDVGAGTVDVAAFNVHKEDGEDVFPILGKSVENHGVHFLHQHRLTSAGIAPGDPRAPFKGGITDAEVARTLGLKLETLKHNDIAFGEHVRDQVSRVVRQARGNYPLSRRWDEGVPFFLCGGGSRAAFYSALAEQMIALRNPCRLVQARLPRPDRLQADRMTEESYDRISVAYGLSFDPLDIGRIIRTDELPRIDPVVPERGQCPRCNGTGGLHRPCDRCGGTGLLG
ncbi:MAG: hypothetical protein JSS77_12940 [Acidobacteria bacterium]|nr:hypothetical protein [Acidobacteriota bacterium]